MIASQGPRPGPGLSLLPLAPGGVGPIADAVSEIVRPVRVTASPVFPRTWWIARDSDGEACVWSSSPLGRSLVVRRSAVNGPLWARLAESLPDRGDCRGCTTVPCTRHQDVDPR